MFANILLQAPSQGNSWMMPLMMVGMIVVMYFFMIRPQQKKAKEAKNFADSMTAGDKIVTTSGIHGKIIKTNSDNTILVEVDRNTNVTIERQAISMELTQAYLKRSKSTTEVTA
jgi:preprotein translocase subunit YajC